MGLLHRLPVIHFDFRVFENLDEVIFFFYSDTPLGLILCISYITDESINNRKIKLEYTKIDSKLEEVWLPRP